jgi:hypothetical protein
MNKLSTCKNIYISDVDIEKYFELLEYFKFTFKELEQDIKILERILRKNNSTNN